MYTLRVVKTIQLYTIQKKAHTICTATTSSASERYISPALPAGPLALELSVKLGVLTIRMGAKSCLVLTCINQIVNMAIKSHCRDDIIKSEHILVL